MNFTRFIPFDYYYYYSNASNVSNWFEPVYRRILEFGMDSIKSIPISYYIIGFPVAALVIGLLAITISMAILGKIANYLLYGSWRMIRFTILKTVEIFIPVTLCVFILYQLHTSTSRVRDEDVPIGNTNNIREVDPHRVGEPDIVDRIFKLF